MKAETSEILIARLRDITAALPKDDNGYVGSNASEKFENMMVHLVMAWNGVSEEDARAMRGTALKQTLKSEIQQSMAENCP